MGELEWGVRVDVVLLEILGGLWLDVGLGC